MKILLSRLLTLASAAFASTLIFTTIASAQYTEQMLINFSGFNYGTDPEALVRDSAGNLYSIVTSPENTNCGKSSCGQVIKATANSSGIYTEGIIHTMAGGTEGYNPGSILLDSNGNIFGSALYGGDDGTGCRDGCGTIFELQKLSGGGYAFSVLYTFTSSTDGDSPFLYLIDPSGNLIGVSRGGAHGQGQIFEISPSTGGTWTKSVLYTFKGGTTDFAATASYMDASGNIYGTTPLGGNVTTNCAQGCGQVVEFSPSTGGTLTKTVLYNFNGAPDGSFPITLIPDGSGNIWGTTYSGGSGTNSHCSQLTPVGCGTLFELSPNGSGGWTETVQHDFNWTLDGQYPVGLLYDGAGNFYLNVYEGTIGQFGGVMKFSLASDGIWQYTMLHSFADDKGGGLPYFTVLDSAGNVYGTVLEGGTHLDGGIYELSPQ